MVGTHAGLVAEQDRGAFGGGSGFADVEVRDRPAWLERGHALWGEAAALDPGDDPALRSFHAEAVRSLQWTGLGLLRRVLAVASKPR